MITEIAVERTVDPMHEVMDCLFAKCEILISNKILDVMKKFHSYTKITNVSDEKYIFHRRTRGTDALFSFIVTTGVDGNKVSDLECIVAEFGPMDSQNDIANTRFGNKVYIMLQGEGKNF